MVSWEYPPVVVGGLGRHVYQLATALAAAGHEIVVLSRVLQPRVVVAFVGATLALYAVLGLGFVWL